MAANEPGWYPDPSDPSLHRWWDGGRWTDHVARDGATWLHQLPATRPVKSRGRMPVWAWILIGSLLLIPAFLLSPLGAMIALIVLVTAVVSRVKRTPTWLRIRTRRTAAGVTAVAAAAFLMFGGVAVYAQSTPTAQRVEAVRFAGSETSRAESEADAKPRPSSTPTAVTTVSEEVVTEPVPFEDSTVDDANLPKGQTKVTTIGQAGERTLTYRVTLVDGAETKRDLISDVVTMAPVTQVTSVGTYEPPPPPPPPPAPAQQPGCDSNYAEACVPVSSDVDCAGGSGDGPAYFDGVARVVGSDIYDLDRDGDGYACEPW